MIIIILIIQIKMKTKINKYYLVLETVLFYITAIYLSLFVAAADSLAAKGLLFPAILIAVILIVIDIILIKAEDIRRFTGIK